MFYFVVKIHMMTRIKQWQYTGLLDDECQIRGSRKVSVFMMDDWTEAQRLYDLPGVMVKSHNVLV